MKRAFEAVDRNRNRRWNLLIFLSAAAVYILMATADRITADEAYTFAMIRHSFQEIWQITGADVHPPLYYYLTKLWTMVFGSSQLSLRLFSALCYLLILGIGGAWVSRAFDRRSGTLFMVLFFLFPFALEYAVEARMYPLAALFVMLTGIFAWDLWTGGAFWNWIGLVLAGTGAAYCHYFSLAAVGVIYGLLFLGILIRSRKLLLPFAIASVVTIGLYVPWLRTFLAQLAYKVDNEYWIAPITARTLIDYVLNLLNANGHSYFPLYFGLLILGLLFVSLRDRLWAGILALLVPLITAAVGIAASILVRPVFILRYLLPCAPLMVFFLAVGISHIQKQELLSGAVAVLLVSFSGNLLGGTYVCLTQQNTLNADFIAQTADAEGYVLLSENALSISQDICYYQQELPVYTDTMLGADNPYPNRHAAAELEAAQPQVLILMTMVDEQPDADCWQDYRMEKLGTVHELYHSADAWRLTRTAAPATEAASEET